MYADFTPKGFSSGAAKVRYETHTSYFGFLRLQEHFFFEYVYLM